VLTITLRDLQYRRRQFGIAVLGAALVFGLTLLLTGMSAGFRKEARDTVRDVGADAWIVPRGVTGPFTSDSAMPEELAAKLARTPGVRAAEPVAEFQHVARRPDGSEEPVNVIGQPEGGLAGPGRNERAPGPGEVVASDRLGVDAGAVIAIGGRRLRVARVVEDASYFAGGPIVFAHLRDAQAIGFGGGRLAGAIVTRGMPRSLPADLALLTNADVRADIRQPVENAAATIDAVRAIMWVVAALIIGAVTYLSALERVRDFAVLKAVGGSSRTLALSLTLQAVLAALLAAMLSVGLAQLMEPAVTLPVVTEGRAIVVLMIVAAVVGVLSSLAALRRALAVDPALAFAG
jgi:putative ABC transport system permease protein